MAAVGGLTRAQVQRLSRPSGASLAGPKPAASNPAGHLLGLQRSAGNRAAGVAVQRHASWEHKMLGDMDPATLEVIASGRDAAASRTKTVSAGGKPISVANVTHALDQEIRRIGYFRDMAPTTGGAKAEGMLAKLDTFDRRREASSIKNKSEKALVLQNIEDTKWDVRLVEIPLSDGTKGVVTYGEMNTLADFYGSPKEITETPAENFRHILAGIREESVRKLMRLRNEVGGDKHYDADGSAAGFEGSIGNTGTGDVTGELKLMGKIPFAEGKAAVPGKPETGYQAGLARNACHFAPQSWHSWAGYHEEALGLAKQAKQLHDTGDAVGGDAKANEAVFKNGFGDHFLEDSFAAGHLINKTLIMQWFVKWLDAHPMKSDQTTDENWRASQAMAHSQPGLAARGLYTAPIGPSKASDPQSAENTKGGLRARFDAAGLAVPDWVNRPVSPEFLVFTWWQRQAMAGNVVFDIKDLMADSPIKSERILTRVLTQLHADGVIHYESYSTGDMAKGVGSIGVKNFLGVAKNFQIRAEYIPERPRAYGRALTGARGGDGAAFERMAKVTGKNDYTTFLNNSYLQIATNVLHDDFCKNGLVVKPGAGSGSFKVYGDNAMLQTGSTEGVTWSAETARASRDSIYETVQHGNPGAGHSTPEISDRFPKKVTPVKNGGEYTLEAWHGEGGQLWKYCDTKSFPEASAFFAKGTVAGLMDMAPTLSQDDAHKGEGF